MIATAVKPCNETGKQPSHEFNRTVSVAAQNRYLELLPRIRRQARYAFRNASPERREDLVAEVLANTWAAFVRLVERGAEDVAYATPLAKFAIRQVRAGRRVGMQSNARDVYSEVARQRRHLHPVQVEPLQHFDQRRGVWTELLVEDRRCTPAEIAAVRIDFRDWLQSLTTKQRRIARLLASGESTGAVARKFQLTPGRISQLRRQLRDDWQAFTADRPSNGRARVCCA